MSLSSTFYVDMPPVYFYVDISLICSYVYMSSLCFRLFDLLFYILMALICFLCILSVFFICLLWSYVFDLRLCLASEFGYLIRVDVFDLHLMYVCLRSAFSLHATFLCRYVLLLIWFHLVSSGFIWLVSFGSVGLLGH